MVLKLQQDSFPGASIVCGAWGGSSGANWESDAGASGHPKRDSQTVAPRPLRRHSLGYSIDWILGCSHASHKELPLLPAAVGPMSEDCKLPLSS